MIAKKEIQTFHQADRILLCATDFIYILPHPMLRTQISNYTIAFPSQNTISDNYTVLPHGSATLVFSFDGSGIHGDLFGPLTKSCVVGKLASQHDMLLIIEFQPAGLYAFTGVHQKELANQTIAFDSMSFNLNQLILETLDRTDHVDELINHLERILLGNLCTTYPAELLTATELMIKKAGNISHTELSGLVYYSERHLNRIFEQYLGMNTKTFSRIIRINKTIRLLQDPKCNITSASCDTGFYDLPHFIHEFKSICGMTPREYRNNMSDFYSEIAKF